MGGLAGLAACKWRRAHLLWPRASFVMAGLDLTIHAAPLRMHGRLGTKRPVVDGRVKPGDDVFALRSAGAQRAAS